MEYQELAQSKNIGIWNTLEKNKYDNNLTTEIKQVSDDYSNREIVIIVILFLIIVFISDKSIKKKAKKKLNKYL